MHNFSVVIETLQGAGAGPNCKLAQNTTESQTVSFSLSQELAAAVPPSGLSLWRTTAGDLFVEQPKVLPSTRSDGTATVELTIGVDAMYTLTTVQEDFTTERRGSASSASICTTVHRALTRMRMIRWHDSSLSCGQADGAASGISGSRRAGTGCCGRTREPPGTVGSTQTVNLHRSHRWRKD